MPCWRWSTSTPGPRRWRAWRRSRAVSSGRRRRRRRPRPGRWSARSPTRSSAARPAPGPAGARRRLPSGSTTASWSKGWSTRRSWRTGSGPSSTSRPTSRSRAASASTGVRSPSTPRRSRARRAPRPAPSSSRSKVMEAIALVAFGVFALLDWLAVSRSVRPVEYVAKPATLLALLVYAGCGHPSPWLVAALAFSLLGDVFLMLPADLFLAGLAAFLVAHLAYIGAFAGPVMPRLVWLAVVIGALLHLEPRDRGSRPVPRLRHAHRLEPVRASAPVGAAGHHRDLSPGAARPRHRAAGVMPAGPLQPRVRLHLTVTHPRPIAAS